MRQKSEFEIWLDKYYDRFKKNYPLSITSMAKQADIIAEIKKCIETGKEAKSPDYKKGNVY